MRKDHSESKHAPKPSVIHIDYSVPQFKYTLRHDERAKTQLMQKFI